MATVRHLFARGNTARGAQSLYASAFQGLQKLILLAGYPGNGKSTLLQRIADQAAEQGERVELFHSPLCPDDLDAVLIRSRQIAIADERACDGEGALHAAQRLRIDLGQAVNLQQLSATAPEIEALHMQIAEAHRKAYDSFATALRIHDEWEAIYISKMDFQKADQIGQELIATLFAQRASAQPGAIRHLFLGAATAQGAVDHIPSLTSDLQRRILIKGRPGSGKSSLLKRLANAAQAKGYDVDLFHCGFDPNSLDMLIFPALSLAIFDSTAPHEYFPSQRSDEILDMYDRAIAPGTDEAHAAAIALIKERYAQKMQEAIAYLKEAQRLHLELRAHYSNCSDFAQVDALGSQLQRELFGT